jgi:hypothetical protein
VSFDQLVAQVGKDLEWLSFYARYCAGKNIEKSFCRDFEWWALGIAAIVFAIVAWWILGKIARAYGNWRHRKMLAKVADPETMKKHVWSGYDSPDAVPSSEQRAAKSRKPERP